MALSKEEKLAIVEYIADYTAVKTLFESGVLEDTGGEEKWDEAGEFLEEVCCFFTARDGRENQEFLIYDFRNCGRMEAEEWRVEEKKLDEHGWETILHQCSLQTKVKQNLIS